MANYRKDHPLPKSKLRNGLLRDGESREVYVEGMDHPVYAECYTLTEAAEALGKTRLGLRRWVVDGLIPPAILKDTSRQYNQYSRGELEAIRFELVKHEEEFQYLTLNHDHTIHRIWQAVQAYRATRI